MFITASKLYKIFSNFLDVDYERQVAETYKIPEVVRNFLIYLSKAISEGNVYELQNLYENT